MQTKHSAVKVKGKVVAEVNIPQYDSVQEALDIIGETKLLSLINQRIMVVEQNKARTANSDKPAGKMKLVKAAFSILTMDDYQQLQGKTSEEVEAYLTSETMTKRVHEAVAAGQIKL